MELLFSAFSKYILSFLMALYAFSCFKVFKYKTEHARRYIYFRQTIYMVLIYSVSFLMLLIGTGELKYFGFYIVSMLCIIIVQVLYKYIYKNANRLVVNNMCMLLSVGFIIISRISFDKAVRQFIIAMVTIVLTGFIPYLISRAPRLSSFKWIYVITGLLSLLIVLVFSVTTFGAKLNITLFGFTFQPSELVKIIFIFAMASFLQESVSFKQIVIATVIAGAHVLILVFSKDLGGAVILFFVYICMLYVASRKLVYLLAGIAAGSVGAFLGFKMFSHVRVRVSAFLDPFSTINDAGYQIAQSLFAIGTGGLFGMGLYEGAPNKIPVVMADFIYSAISEEFGSFFGICLILICLSCFMMFMNISMLFDNLFYKYVAVGLAALYGFQVLLTIGGVTKFIPLTGVTLPLVSYGGTSVIVTLIMFSIIQGMYIGKDTYPQGD